MSKWRCKLSGTVIDIPEWEDKNMEGHDGYELVEEVVEEQPKKQAKAKKEATE